MTEAQLKRAALLVDTYLDHLAQGPVNLAFAEVPPTPVDVIGVEWQLVGERLVNDLINQTPFKHGEAVTFEAHWLPQVPPNAYARSV